MDIEKFRMQTSALFYQTDSWVTGMQEPKLKVNYIPHGQLLQHKEISRGVCRRNIYKGNWDNDAKGEESGGMVPHSLQI